jgi:hypothetical protein
LAHYSAIQKTSVPESDMFSPTARALGMVRTSVGVGGRRRAELAAALRARSAFEFLKHLIVCIDQLVGIPRFHSTG